MGSRAGLVAELLEQVAGNPLEGGDVLGGHVLAPASDPARRRAQEPLLVRLGRDIDVARVLEHPRLEGNVREGADTADDRVRVGDELFVAQLVVSALPDPAPEGTRVADLLAPEAREASRSLGMGPSPRIRPFRHLEE